MTKRMSNSRELDYQLGRDLGQAAQSIKQRSPSQLFSIILDLLKEDRSLQAPLRELAHTPAFLKATPLNNSAASSALVSALVNEMRNTYRNETIQRLHHILAGYFSLSAPSQPRETSKDQPDSSDITQLNEPSARAINEATHNKTPWGAAQHLRIGSTSRLELLRELLQNKQWHQADRLTWTILSESFGENKEGLIPQRAWNAIPCNVLYDINRLWTANSSYRFGFATQRAVWEEAHKIQASLEQEVNKDSEISTKPARQAFLEFLSDPEDYILEGTEEKQKIPDIIDFPPGYFPRIGKRMSWGGAKGWITEYKSNHLIDEFEFLCARLMDCGIPSTSLDSETKQKVASLLIVFNSSQSHSKEASRQNENHQTYAGSEENREAIASNSKISNTSSKRDRSQNNHSPATLPQNASRKPKGFSTMCWIGLILSGIGFAYSWFLIIWQILLHERLNIVPSLVSLGINSSDTEIFYESILFFVYGSQLGLLAEMLQKRANRIRGLLVTFMVDIIIGYLESQSSTNDMATTSLTMLVMILQYAIPTAYFCRQPVYSYLKKT
jgi:hypothetical protein